MSQWQAEDPNTALSILAVEESYSEAEIAEAIENTKVQLRLSLKRFVYSGVLFLGCVFVISFVGRHSPQPYRQSIGRLFLFLWMGGWVLFVTFGGFAWSAWKCLYDLKKELKQQRTSKI